MHKLLRVREARSCRAIGRVARERRNVTFERPRAAGAQAHGSQPRDARRRGHSNTRVWPTLGTHARRGPSRVASYAGHCGPRFGDQRGLSTGRNWR
jgi:hypothetical protein